MAPHQPIEHTVKQRPAAPPRIGIGHVFDRQSLAQGIEQRYGSQPIDQLASLRDQQQIAVLQALKQQN